MQTTSPTTKGNTMLMSIEATMNPDAVEIRKGGKALGTIRKDWPGHVGNWTLVLPSEEGATAVPADVLLLATRYIQQQSRTA